MSEPAFRKFTPAVERGLKYALTGLEMDAEHEPTVTVRDSETGKQVQVGVRHGVDNADLRAAADWLRYQMGRRQEEVCPTSA